MINGTIDYNLIESSYACENCKHYNTKGYFDECELCNQNYYPPSFYTPKRKTIQAKAFNHKYSRIKNKEYMEFLRSRRALYPHIINEDAPSRKPTITNAKPIDIPIYDVERGKYAIVLNESELEAFLIKYKQHFSDVVEHLEILDDKFADALETSIDILEHKTQGDLSECVFLSSSIDGTIGAFTINEYPTTEKSCELLTRWGYELRWKEYKDETVYAISIESNNQLRSFIQVEEALLRLVGDYLPDDFNIYEHLGALRIYNKKSNSWNISRPDLVLHFKRLVEGNRYCCSNGVQYYW